MATVNGEPIDWTAYEELLDRNVRRLQPGGKAVPATTMGRMQESVLQQLVQHALVAQKANELHIVVSAQELNDKLAAHRGRFRSPASYEDYLARANTTDELLARELSQSLLTERVVAQLGGDCVPATSEVEQHYRDNLERFVQPGQLRAHRLWLAYPANASPRDRAATLQRARRLKAAARGKGAFEALCRAHSAAPEAAQGGDLGLVAPGRFVELERMAAAGLQPPDISDPVVASDGVALFRVDAFEPSKTKTLAEASSSIVRALSLRKCNERKQKVLRTLAAEATIESRLTPAAGVAPAAPAANQAAFARPAGGQPAAVGADTK